MICRFVEACNSSTCPNHKSHPYNNFCSGGKCPWGENTYCVPDSNKERVESLLTEHFTDQEAKEMAEKIDSIYKEAV